MWIKPTIETTDVTYSVSPLRTYKIINNLVNLEKVSSISKTSRGLSNTVSIFGISFRAEGDSQVWFFEFEVDRDAAITAILPLISPTTI